MPGLDQIMPAHIESDGFAEAMRKLAATEQLRWISKSVRHPARAARAP